MEVPFNGGQIIPFAPAVRIESRDDSVARFVNVIESPDGFVHALKQQNYFTALESEYRAALHSVFGSLGKKLALVNV